jgi:hypothetical protein
VAPDRLFIAHELPLGLVRRPEEVTADMLRPNLPADAVQTARFLGKAGSLTLKVAATPLVLAALASGKITQTILTAPTISLPVILDPVLLGVVVAKGSDPIDGEMGVWFELARWVA